MLQGLHFARNGVVTFFRLIVDYNSLVEWFKINFDFLSRSGLFTLTEINNMTPYERDIWKSLTIDFLKKKKGNQ